MACIMVMMTYSMVRIELVYFMQNSELYYYTSERTLTYHLFSPPTLFISDDKEPEDCVIHYKIDVIGIAIEIKPKKEIITNDGLEIVQEMTLMNDKYNANAEKAMDIICGRIGLETKSLSTLPSAEDIITIKMIDNQLNTRRSFWINDHIKVTNLIQPFWYLNCEKCTKATGYEFE
nr:uncharacterized protein LOC112492116 [Ziziphus jujuba var. spinosa]